jgi:hypothetical protein
VAALRAIRILRTIGSPCCRALIIVAVRVRTEAVLRRKFDGRSIVVTEPRLPPSVIDIAVNAGVANPGAHATSDRRQ